MAALHGPNFNSDCAYHACCANWRATRRHYQTGHRVGAEWTGVSRIAKDDEVGARGGGTRKFFSSSPIVADLSSAVAVSQGLS